MSRKLITALFSVFLLTMAASAAERSGTVTIRIVVNSPDNARTVRIWLPYPVSDRFQKIEDMKIEGNYMESAVYFEPESEALYMYASWDGIFNKRELVMSFKARSREVRFADLKDSGEPVPVDVMKHLEPNRWIPTDGNVNEIAQEIIKGKKGILEKSRAVYDWVVENTHRDPNVKGCGLGIVEQTLAKRGGKCADISSVYVALARAAGVPAREVFGLRLGKKDDQNITKGFNCWAEFYLPGTGWVPVHPADVRKIMLVNNLGLKDAQPYIDYYFGGLDQYRIALERSGRGIAFIPPQEEGKLNYFMYPYVEVNGKALDYFDPKSVGYSLSFRAR
jgi:transglutaminase-like putative cysteine protease